MKREPVVAGYFYPGKEKDLIKMLKSFIREEKDKKEAKGLLVPHAGYIYSGDVAGKVYSKAIIADEIIILCPNHTGRGESIAIMNEGSWLTPLGEVKINSEIANLIINTNKEVKIDHRAHEEEHSLEVQLPFLQFLKEKFTLVPICIRAYEYEKLEKLGYAIAEVINLLKRNILLIASSDMTHYESAESAKKKDDLAIEKMMKIDPKGLYETIIKHNISMCGYLPATAMLVALRELKASCGELIAYSNSGAKTGDYREVVAYAGMLFN